MILILLVFIFLIIAAVVVYVLPKFGRHPSGERLEKIKASQNYINGSFHNKSSTPALTEGVSYFKAFKEFFFDRNNQRVRIIPSGKIPSVKTNLPNLNIEEDILVWFGHSSYYMQIDKKRYLIDPVFSGSASPFSFLIKAFKGTDIYTPDDIPEIDYLFITHDHWDHLDHDTIIKLKPKIKKIICGLGTGEHLEYWGFDKSIIMEKDWDEKFSPEDGVTVHTVSTRHFSGRGLKRNKALWMAFVLQTPSMNIYIGGDSGYDSHFKTAGNTFGEFDLAIIELGQYNHKWRYIHLLPKEFIPAAKEIKAKKIFPVHSSKFALSSHPWDEPLKLITEYNMNEELNVITPMIGEKVLLKDTGQEFSKWWEKVDTE